MTKNHDEILETYKSAVIFFKTSLRREGLFKYIYSVRFESSERHNSLIGLCGTRWSERHIPYERFVGHYRL